MIDKKLGRDFLVLLSTVWPIFYTEVIIC